MSLALHGHHILLIASFAFVAAVLTPNWYTSPDGTNINVFQICTNFTSNHSCQWSFTLQSNNSLFANIKILYPILIASFALACGGLSLIALLLGSWYIEKYAIDNGSKWLLVLTILATLLSFLLSCAVWAIILTTNLQQKIFGITDIRLQDFGYSFWINIGASGAYLYALLIYLIAVCKN